MPIIENYYKPSKPIGRDSSPTVWLRLVNSHLMFRDLERQISQVCYRTIAGLCGVFLFCLIPSTGAQAAPLQVNQVVRSVSPSGDDVVIVNWTGGTPPFRVTITT